MISLSLSIEDRVGPALKNFSDPKTVSRVVNFILARVGRRYRLHLRSRYLAGQMINGGRGDDSLNSRILVYKVKREKNVYRVGEKGKNTANATNVHLANIYEHAGGYTILPKNKKILMFVTSDGFWHFAKKIQGKQRPFMSASYASFGWNQAIDGESNAVISRELTKEGIV